VVALSEAKGSTIIYQAIYQNCTASMPILWVTILILAIPQIFMLNSLLSNYLQINLSLPLMPSSVPIFEDVATTKITNNKNNGHTIFCPFPKIIHMIYVSPKLPLQQDPIPNKVIQRAQEYQIMHPDWQIMFWNNSMVHHYYPHLVQLMTNVTTMAWVADMVRYRAIFDFGGVYLDTDFDMFQALDGICLHGVGNFIVCEKQPIRPDQSNDTNIVMDRDACQTSCNGVMGFKAKHPAMEEVVNVMLRKTQNYLSNNPNPTFFPFLRTTGPPIFSNIVKKDTTVDVLYPYTFLPCGYDEQEYCKPSNFWNDTRVFAMHEWSHSWGKPSKETKEH